MKLSQIENTPIGNYFHDSGIFQVFNELAKNVDDFEADSDELCVYCDSLVSMLKGLKSKIKQVESEAVKRQAQEKVSGLIQRGGIE
ncbi:hypothetical protein SAMN04487977_101549 [Treponema bryantii]|uniref:Uncharacterized protein n=1 Tax=Treponema bryantii TaxID=163 RepID=A0A1H9B2K0_9SPIR|nr:hypothetical protein [Treponema bryantii]SEP82967.1 hypothetical protein SAMN04487977_101549 [Treponema bryantii]